MKSPSMFLLVAALPLASACASTSPYTARVCAQLRKGICTSYEERETEIGRWRRETADALGREQAYERGTAFFPERAVGESTAHHAQRLLEEHERQQAAQRGQSWAPPAFGSPGPSTPSFDGSARPSLGAPSLRTPGSMGHVWH